MGDVAGKLLPPDVSDVDAIAPAYVVPLEVGESFLGAKIKIESPITITKKIPSETAMSSNFFFSIELTMPLNE
jgi:hypothetical protein